MEIYLTKGVQQIGPFTKEEVYNQIQSGATMGTDLAWCEGQSDWVPLSNIITIPDPVGLSPNSTPPALPIRQSESSDMDTGARSETLVGSQGVCSDGEPPPAVVAPGALPVPVDMASHNTKQVSISNLTATLGSLIIPGLGQLGQGRNKPALHYFLLALLLWLVVFGWVVHLASAIDAATYRRK